MKSKIHPHAKAMGPSFGRAVTYTDGHKPTIVSAENMLQVDAKICKDFGVDRFNKICAMVYVGPEYYV